MAQIVPKSNFAAELGTGIGTGLSRLAENKIAQLQQRQQAEKFKPFVEDQETADWIQSLQPKEQLKALQWLQASNTPAAQQFQQQLQPARQQVDELAAPEQFRSSAQPFLNQLGGVPQNLQLQQQQPLPQNLAQQRMLADQLRAQQEQAGMAQRAMQQQQPQQQVQPQSQQSNLPSLKKALAAGAMQRANPQNVKLSKSQEKYEESYNTAEKSIEILNRMDELWRSGELSNGRMGALGEYINPSDVNQEFMQLGDTLAGMLVSQYGTPTNAKIKFTQSLKPQLGQTRNVQKRGIDRLRSEAMKSMELSKSKLPQGYFGQEQAPQQQMQREMERPEQKKVQESSKQKYPEGSSDNLNWFAKKAREEAQESSVSKEEEGWGDWFKRNLNAVHAKASGVSEERGKAFQEWLSDLTKGKSDLPEGMKQSLEEERKNNLTPRNTSEAIVQDVLSSLPYAGLNEVGGKLVIGMPANLTSQVGRLVAGTAAGNLAKEAGGGVVSQIAASLLANKGVDATKNWLDGVKAKNIKDFAQAASKELRSVENELGKNISVKADKYVDQLEGLANEVRKTTSMPESEKSALLKKVQNWFGDVDGKNRISASDIAKREKDIMSSLYSSEVSKSKEYKDYLDRARNIMLEEGDRIGKSHTKWFNAWKDADKIDKAINYKPQLFQFLEDNPKLGKIITNPVAQILISGGGAVAASVLGKPGSAVKALGTTLGAAAVLKGYKKAAEVAAFAMSKDPKLQAIAKEATKAVLERNVPAATKAFAQANRRSEKYAGLI